MSDGTTRPSAAIVSVGNELLFGLTVDTNAAWLGRTLEAKGIGVVRRFTVADVASDIRDALASAMESADVVFVSGGLGPTPDDVTKAAVAEHFGLDLVVDEGVQDALLRRFRVEGLAQIPELSRGQAEVPAGSQVLPNPLGTAPGILLKRAGKRVVLLPGVPGELKAIVDGALSQALEQWLGGRFGLEPVHHVVVHTTGIRETRLAEEVEGVLAEAEDALTSGISLAYLPDALGVDLRFTVRGGDASTATAHVERLVAVLQPLLEPYRFEAPSGDLSEAVARELRRGTRTLAVAESCTGGLLGERLTAPAGASDVFVGGVIAYANAVKIDHLGVSEPDLAPGAVGAVSESVALQMVRGVTERFGTDAGLSITGVAGPGGGSEEKPVGTVWIGVALDGKARATRHTFAGDRALVRQRAAQAALHALYRALVVREPAALNPGASS